MIQIKKLKAVSKLLHQIGTPTELFSLWQGLHGGNRPPGQIADRLRLAILEVEFRRIKASL